MAVLAVLFFTAVVSATDIYVPEGGNQTIQQAVNNASGGDTIIVRDGIYHENVNVDVAHLTIRSENGSANCIVNASGPNDYVFNVAADYVNITGFTVENATGNHNAGIYLESMEHCNISYNNARNNNYGIYLYSSCNNTLTENTANSNNYCGIHLNDADNNNNVSCNWVQNNSVNGFRLYSGSTGNTIERNNIIANGALQADGSYHWNFYNDQGNAVDAKNNYWVATDNETIDKSIYDDEEGNGKVTFYPPLKGASPCAPIPEAATIILFSVGLVVLAGYVVLRGRK
ncbi:MAG: hypothetical protein SRB1_01310 [Desulfobacteraceae bacterium Eth-SRB1]|uniref:Periplasmic copper-binding protein NosD beta helix domain-containing protein n=1 Tax=Candidatus Argoarchaeum ethanivorans TaxID=2608793 RepID=A0A8B3RYM6_9EURY|nr:MAG: hypothetical protein AEth_01779 [Candidatus Argoarchaeum ethanivorans]RZB32458.1 MAG: hypothetical protein SRB1_01310 [Desulfobacteraceae bacterium Eth-SRB1]